MTAYYNENDPKCAAWLRELIKADLIAPGEVDERSIEDVVPSELMGYRQCHFFAGIGVWSYALRCAGWSDDRPAWTGSCPCQPFSAAGKRKGVDDERHLWPAWFWLIGQCKPVVVFGEQVAGKGGETWFDLVSNDLEGEGYTVGACVTAACGFGAPHQRKRLYFVANTDQHNEFFRSKAERKTESSGRSRVRGVADTDNTRPQGHGGLEREHGAKGRKDTIGHGSKAGEPDNPGPTNGHWRDADWLFCRDGKWRCVEPGTFPLVDGTPARVGRLRGYGNALVAPQAEAFVRAYMERADYERERRSDAESTED